MRLIGHRWKCGNVWSLMILIGRGLNLVAELGRDLREPRIKVNLICAVVRVRLASEKKFPVIIARGIHLFPYRTQKLSLLALKVPGWQRPGRLGRRRIPMERVGEAGMFLQLVPNKGTREEAERRRNGGIAKRWNSETAKRQRKPDSP